MAKDIIMKEMQTNYIKLCMEIASQLCTLVTRETSKRCAKVQHIKIYLYKDIYIYILLYIYIISLWNLEI